MSWLYGQTWLWYLIAFLVGVLLAWLFLVLPAQRRLRGLQGRTAAGTGPDDTPDDDAITTVGRAAPAAAAVGLGGAGLAAAAVAAAEEPDREPDPVTEQFPAVDSALGTLDSSMMDPGTVTDSSTDTTPTPVVDPDAATGAIPATDVGTPAGADPTAALPAVEHGSGAGTQPGTTQPGTTPYGPGSAHPDADGSAPGDEYTIKGNANSMRYHAPESPYYIRTRAEAWFMTVEHAEAAGFGPWHRNRKRAAVQGLAAQESPSFEPGPYPGSAKPAGDGSAPTAAFMIKGNGDSMLYHLPASPYYGRTKAEVWFIHESDARAAGFTAWART